MTSANADRSTQPRRRGAPAVAVLDGARAAMALLTRVPAGAASITAGAWSWAPGWFPLVGAGIGALSAAVWWLASSLGTLPAAVLAVLTSTAVTGALHEDGLADTADALGGARTREAIFEILKDSRVGAFGAVALVMSILLRVALLSTLAGQAAVALVLAHALARLGPTWLLVALPYVTPPAVARSGAVARAGWTCAAMATAWTMVITIGALGVPAMSPMGMAAAFVGVGASTLLAGWYFRARAGGITGDFLGAAEQVGEVVVLMVLAATVTAR